MDLAARKLYLMEQFMKIASAEKLERLESFFKREILEENSFDELPDVVKQILDKSEEDSKLGRVKSHKEVMSNIKAKYNIA